MAPSTINPKSFSILKRFLPHLLLFLTLLPLAGCHGDDWTWLGGDDAIEEGSPIAFTTLVPDDSRALRTTKEEWQQRVDSFKPVSHDYHFTIEMYRQGEDSPQGCSTYRPTQTTGEENPIAGYDGTLKVEENATPLYWQDNVNRWGFKAVANAAPLSADQGSQEKWLAMDHLAGHSYLPIWDADAGTGNSPDEMLSMTSKEWYKANQAWLGPSLMDTEAYKKIPLFMRHQRAWITVILRAGEGVQREALNFQNAASNIKMAISSYEQDEQEAITINQPWAKEVLIDYPADKNGPEQTGVSSTRYDAIVMPHNYAERKDEDIIAKINLSTQHFSFYASNDQRYVNGTTEEQAAADEAYNLEAGKHLTIEVTLSRESRKILITAWIEDWTEVATSTICDDYGQNGDPVVIANREELIAFLSDPKKNCQGSVGIIQPTELNLDAPEAWTTTYDLHATLNLAGCQLTTSHQLFRNIGSSGNLANGTILVPDGTTVPYVVAGQNDGTIERVNVSVAHEGTTAKATVAAFVGLNHGTIYQCSSTLPVSGDVGCNITTADGHTYRNYVGGLAAVSVKKDETSMAVIDGCTVNAAVSGGSTVKGGGIVGYAGGRVSSNTFEYGITVRQDASRFKNIFATATADLRAYSNAWPTSALNRLNPQDEADTSNPNAYAGQKFDAVIDCQADLATIMGSVYNAADKNYRLSKGFAVESTAAPATDWKFGTVHADDHNATNNVRFNLDGNGKTISLRSSTTDPKKVKTTTGSGPTGGNATEYTTAPMLFNYVLGEIKDLTLLLEQSLVAAPSVNSSDEYSAEDAIAPLAYAVYGAKGRLSNIQVKAATADINVQAATAAGLVVWAYGGATIANCKVKVPVRMWMPETLGTQAKHYAGGIVACAARAKILESVYLGNTADAVSGAANSTAAKGSVNNYYGGIVGGTVPKGAEDPCLQIADCTSWFSAVRATAESTDKSSKAAIIAYTCYASSSSINTVKNGMDADNPSVGNWWQLDAVGAHTWAEGLSEEKVIGKRNSVMPDYDNDF